MTEEEQFFWDRVAGMPALEAEQELVLRRESVSLELRDLTAQRLAAETRRDRTAMDALGRQMFMVNQSITLVSERIKYLRRLQDRIQWRNAVTTLYGQDAYEACAVWVAQHDEGDAFRREWASQRTKGKRARQSGGTAPGGA